MNQLCKVCGEPAAGFHFGAFTCEGCKSFFGRTYNNLSSVSECKNNGQCVINKKNRTACKACRLRKCLLVGMSKSGSRYGRRSNWFKIHCLLQEQSQNGSGLVTPPGLLRPHPYMPFFRNLNVINTELKSSESDSGASSADPEDEIRSASVLSCLGITPSPTTSDRSTFSSKKLPSPSSDGEFFANKSELNRVMSSSSSASAESPDLHFPKWLQHFQTNGSPATWRDLWLKASIPIKEPAPEQEQPIDLSVRAVNLNSQIRSNDDESVLNVNLGIPNSKSVPLDLTRNTEANLLTN